MAQRCSLEQMKYKVIMLTHQVLDKQIFAAYRQDIKQTSMTFQLAPLDDHQHNLEEKAIRTWKDHFIGVMSGT